jgi:hypothetical protein
VGAGKLFPCEKTSSGCIPADIADPAV